MFVRFFFATIEPIMSNQKDTLPSSEPYKGVRDFYPTDQALQNYIIGVMRKTAESFGYAEYSASLLEPSELYEAKTGEEIVSEQTYTFIDRGKRRVTLRPEMTPSIARMIARKRRELSIPLRWYSIPNTFRYERPQRGRLREHWQLNADIFGVAGIEAETDLILLAYQVMKNFGAKDTDFEIRISSRKLLDGELSKLGISNEKTKEVRALLDKKDTISDFEDTLEAIASVRTISFEPGRDITQLLTSLSALKITNAKFDSSIIRGFDYYTGIVFEVYDTSPENKRSLFGGGRYDDLLEIFGEERIAAVGFGMGDVTMRDFLEVHDLLPSYSSTTDIFLCTVNKNLLPYTNELAQKLRSAGIRVAVNLSDKKIGDQIKSADKQKIPFVTCIGEDELKSKKITIKELATGEETTFSEDEVADFLHGKRS